MEVLIGIFIVLSVVCTVVIVAACRFAARIENEENSICHQDLVVGDKHQEDSKPLPRK